MAKKEKVSISREEQFEVVDEELSAALQRLEETNARIEAVLSPEEEQPKPAEEEAPAPAKQTPRLAADQERDNPPRDSGDAKEE